MKIGLEYIKYRWKARKRHGIHSPFVYDISDAALRRKVGSKDQAILQALFERLANSTLEIEVEDFGAGSHVLGKKRKVAAIFKTSSSRGKYGRILYQLCAHFQPVRILEFGTSLGVGTAHMHLGAPLSELTTVEACPNTQKIALEALSELRNAKIHFIHRTFADFLQTEAHGSYDFIFVDGHHDGRALLDYMAKLEAFSHAQTVFVLDDIRWSDSMLDAWNTLSAQDEYHVSIDLFRLGILVRRPEQEKEHFVLRP
jgi:predicted O-methyltransferase YrrM